MTIPFIDLAAQQRRRPEIEARLNKVLDHGRYIMGSEEDMEAALATLKCETHNILFIWHGCADTWSFGTGSKARRWGDCASFTFAASAEAIAVLGAVCFAEVGNEF